MKWEKNNKVLWSKENNSNLSQENKNVPFSYKNQFLSDRYGVDKTALYNKNEKITDENKLIAIGIILGILLFLIILVIIIYVGR